MKPDGTPLYVVPLETDEAIYMVKVDVVIDSKFTEEEFDKEILGTSKNDDEIVSANAEEEEEEKVGQDKFVLVHGDYSDVGDVADEDNDEDEEDDE